MRVYKKRECSYCHQTKYIAAHGLCRACYMRDKRNGSVVPKPPRQRTLCDVPGCTKPVASHGKCDNHRIRYKRKTEQSQTRHAEYQRTWRKKTFEQSKNSDLKKNFGITLEDYQLMLDKQNGVCAICGQKEKRIHRATGAPMNLAVDHDHTTGAVRGLLCSPCNHGIGNFFESEVLLSRASEYLKSYKET